MFPDRFVTRFGDITWPALSPDLEVTDYFLWGYVRSKVYETCPANIADLKQRILDSIQGIPKSVLQRVMAAFPLRLQECIERHGGHYQASNSNNNDWDEFSWTWHAPDSVNKIVTLCLKEYFI